jgi:Skp family chaperone for outer membrane proteins
VKKNWLFAGALATAGLLWTAGSVLEPVHAQQQANSNWPGIRIAVVDIGKVFKDYNKFKEMMDRLKGEVDGKEQELRKQEQQIQVLAEQIKAMKDPNDQERVAKEANDKKFEFERNRQKYRDELVQQEAEVYKTCYKELTELLKQYSSENGIHLVMRVQEESDNPQAILQTINRQIVYSHPNLDLTAVMAEGLNQRFKLQK